ncbi:Hypothetical protein AA314_03732 [Archangium gephyra]|uniref:Uncharacterized protein n=1 Tax=Archangium gephyra TaxID=48 RepID=A0AAC8Q7T2_9BACT|nr:Hypothetical protein AA314_03732 [Archangium gephyra]
MGAWYSFAAYFAEHIIMGMPLHIIIIGIPMAIMEFIASQHSFIISIWPASMGIIRHIMPSLPISQVIRAIIGMRIIMGIIIGMPPIIGFMPIMPPIIGFMPIIGI